MPDHATAAALPAERLGTPEPARHRAGTRRGRLFDEDVPGDILCRADPVRQLRSFSVVDAVIPGLALGGCTQIAAILRLHCLACFEQAFLLNLS